MDENARTEEGVFEMPNHQGLVTPVEKFLKYSLDYTSPRIFQYSI